MISIAISSSSLSIWTLPLATHVAAYLSTTSTVAFQYASSAESVKARISSAFRVKKSSPCRMAVARALLPLPSKVCQQATVLLIV